MSKKNKRQAQRAACCRSESRNQYAWVEGRLSWGRIEFADYSYVIRSKQRWRERFLRS
jgi:hypothetical protein